MTSTLESVQQRAVEDRENMRKGIRDVGMIVHGVMMQDTTLSDAGRDKLFDALSILAIHVPKLKRLGAPEAAPGVNRWGFIGGSK